MASTILRWWLVIVCNLGMGFSSAHADGARVDDALAPPTDPKAREHLVRGNRLYRIREFAKAVEEYKAGSLIQPAPVFLYNLGQCHRQLRNYEEALWYYEGFLSRGHPTGELREYVEGFIAEMKTALDKQAMTKPPPSTGASPDFFVAPRSTELPPGLAIVREPWHHDRIGLAITAAGAVAAGVSGALLLSARSLEADANNEDRDLRRIELRDRVEGRRLGGFIAGTAAAGLLIGGIVKLAIQAPPPQRATRPTLGLAFSMGGLVVTGRMSIP